jgi:hypothetical protein
MESNDFTSASNAGANDAASNTGAGSLNASSSTSSTGSTGNTDGTEQSAGMADRASNALGSAKDRLAGVGSTVREKASGAKDSLATALEAGADRLRARAGGDGMSAAGADGSSVAMADGRMAQVSNRVAGGMEGAATWLRDADLDGLKSSVEQQVKEHPGRTLLIAMGVGYLLGKALRK